MPVVCWPFTSRFGVGPRPRARLTHEEFPHAPALAASRSHHDLKLTPEPGWRMVLHDHVLTAGHLGPALVGRVNGEAKIRSTNQEGHTRIGLAMFAMEALADFRTVASVAPSSRYLTRAMLQPLPLGRARVVVELGCGTGVMTQALLDLMPFDATLLAFEINPRFSRYLTAMLSDRRLTLINARAETVEKEAQRRGFERVDAVVSSLGLGFMSDRQRHTFLRGLGHLLDARGVFTQYQYFHGLQLRNGQLGRLDVARLLQRHFSSVQRRIVWRNLPPAFVFVCRGPLGSKTGQHPRNGNS